MTDGERVTYRAVLRNREFVMLLLSQGLSVAGDQLARIAVAVLVFNRTGSAFSASATYAVSYLTYLLGGPVLAAISDRRPRLTVMVVCDVLRAPLVLLMCVNGLPLWSLFVVLGLVGALAPPFDSARGAVQPDILSGEAYVRGNALMQLVKQVSQVVGFAGGGALVAATSSRAALGVDAASFVLSAGMLLVGLRQRPAAQAVTDRSSLLADTREGMRLVLSQPVLRTTLTYALLGSAAVIAPEGLAVPVAHHFGKGALAAGLLTAAVPLGYLASSLVLLRFPVERRLSLLPWLTAIGSFPLMLTPFAGSVGVVAVLWFAAGTAGSVNLIASSSFMQACPREFRARAFGLAGTSLQAVEGGVLLAAGALASLVGSAQSVAAVAVMTFLLLVVTLVRSDISRDLPAQAFSGLGR